ncbi:MAG: hypothetical protein ACXAC5_02930 [Promethearchaeota archaeon]|jgi:hypothetical protein
MLTSELEMTISSDSVRVYTQLAYKHLQERNATMNVVEAGKDDSGQSVFGICMRSDNGEEEWYDPADLGDDAIAGWLNKDEARSVLENKVLPNLGYAIYQRDLQLFHQNMIHE